MPLLLLQLAAHPEEIAATKLDQCLSGGAFFLDFSRPLGRQRFCGVWNRWIGTTMALNVPVIHEGEASGRHVIAVDRVDPYFKELQRLWLERHPLVRQESWRGPAGESPAQVRGSARLVASVASCSVTATAKRTQRSCG